MAARGYEHGHLIEYSESGQRWIYSNNKEPITNKRPCKRCGKNPTPEGYDACLGRIEGVKAACCGHGIEGEAYIWYEGEEEERRG